MTNTSQIERVHEHDHAELNVMNHDLVKDHIDDLLREGAAMRAERSEAERRHEAQEHAAGAAAAGPAVRVRLGHWLVGVGWAGAGRSAESHESAGPAA